MDLTPSFMQTPAWEKMQQRLGRSTYWLNGVLLVNRKMRFGQDYWYAPRTLTEPTAETLDTVFKGRTTFVRLEPQAHLLPKPFISHASVQPRQTLMLDLQKGEEAILAGMKQKTRYNIRLAEKKGVTVQRFAYPECVNQIPVFLQLTKETNLRNQIKSYDQHYYQSLVEELGQVDQAELLVAYHENTPVASMILTKTDQTATYLFGASSSAKQELMASYLLQWSAITDSIAAGLKYYDFWGIRVDAEMAHGELALEDNLSQIVPTPGTTYGVTRFKLGFGGTVIIYPTCFDRSYKHFWYTVYRGFKSSWAARKGFAY